MINMTETYKSSEDVRRGTSRFSKHIKLFSGLSGESLEKSKKERIKKLSAVNRASTWSCNQMGADVALDREEAHTPSSLTSSSAKRFKLPRKFLDDCNAVDHASVPRKLRSAMKKRSRESISPPFPDSKKVNHTTGGAESSTSDKKNSKQNGKNGNHIWCEKPQTCGPITKDEEEVVEALYNLAGMFSGNELKDEINLGSSKKHKLEACDNISAFQEHTDNPLPQPTMEGAVDVNDDLRSIVHLKSDEAVHTASSKERSPEKNIQVMSLNEMIILESVNRCSSQNRHIESDSSITLLNMPSTFAKHDEQKPVCNSVNMCSAPMTYQNTVNLMQPAKLETSPLNLKPEIALGQTTLIGSQLPRPVLIDECNRNGVSSMVLNGAFHHGLPSQSSAAKIPAWLDTALSATRPGAYGPLMGKVSKVNTDRRSWKRCAYHVYISHMTQVFKVPVGKDMMELHQHQLIPHDIMTQGVLMTINDFNGVKNGLKGATSDFEKVDTLDKNSNEARNYIFQNQKLQQSRPQSTLASEMYSSRKDFNFLSLSPGDIETDTKNGLFSAGKGLVPPVQLQVPLNNHVPHPTLMPFSIPQTSRNPSFPDQPSAVTATAAHQGRLQLPSYIGTPLRSPHAIPLAPKQQQHPQNAQQLWMTHLAAQYRTDGTSTALPQLPNWQNGRQNLNPLMGCTHPVIPPSPSPTSLEVLGPRYPHMSHQQQIMAMSSSLSHPRMKKQGNHLSSIYEETGSVFQTGASLPLQLLCNERL